MPGKGDPRYCSLLLTVTVGTPLDAISDGVRVGRSSALWPRWVEGVVFCL